MQGGRKREKKGRVIVAANHWLLFPFCPVPSSPGETEADEEDEEADHFGAEGVGGSQRLSLDKLNGCRGDGLPCRPAQEEGRDVEVLQFIRV